MTSTWRDYESQILVELQAEYPSSQITFNQSKIGRYSCVKRQIDVLIEGAVAGHKFSIAIDAKYYRRKVNVKCVEQFIGLLNDIGVHKGLLISQAGYTKAALRRAFNDPLDVELDILSFADLHRFQSFGAIPYAGKHAVFLVAPFGWVVDAVQYGLSGVPLAHLYQRGLSFHEAWKRGEIIYVQIWDRLKDNESLGDLLELQKQNILNADAAAHIEYLPVIKRNDAETRIRRAKVATNKELVEYTGFVQFKEFILFLVLMTPEELAAKNIRKLESVMLSATPGTITKAPHL